jgi:hypothetical protein
MGGAEDGHKRGVKGPLLMKQKKKGKICFVLYIAGASFFLFIYDVIVKQNLKKRPANHYCQRLSYLLYRARGSLIDSIEPEALESQTLRLMAWSKACSSLRLMAWSKAPCFLAWSKAWRDTC